MTRPAAHEFDERGRIYGNKNRILESRPSLDFETEADLYCFCMNENIKLYDDQGNRLYLTGEERAAFLEAAKKAPRQVRTFCAVLHFTGCRLSEALALTPRRIDLADGTVRFETLKKRRKGVYRAVPVPPDVLDTLDMVHGVSEAQKRPEGPEIDKPLWPWSRTTAWRRVSEVMNAAMIQDGPHKCPNGLRHGYGRCRPGRRCSLEYASEMDGAFPDGDDCDLC